MIELSTKIFADGADIAGIKELSGNPWVKGFTTNPTLMRQAGVSDYLDFSRQVVEIVGLQPLSLEVFSDDFDEMYRQAKILSGLGGSVFVKIPITNTKGQSSLELVRTLSAENVKTNVTAIFTRDQITKSIDAIGTETKAFVSVFAGRIADAGVDPLPTMKFALEQMKMSPNQELIWASPRELFNVFQAHEIGCHVITITHDLIKKLPTLGKDLELFSLETVQMFANDAATAGFVL
jgi:transaldolase